jgi:hypothetical protein
LENSHYRAARDTESGSGLNTLGPFVRTQKGERLLGLLTLSKASQFGLGTTRRLLYEDRSVTNELARVSRSYDDGGEAHDERERTTRARTTDERCSSEKTHAMKRTKRRKQPLTGLLSTNQQRLWKSLATVNLTEIRKETKG